MLDAGLCVNVTKSTFTTDEMHEGIKPQPEKVSAILAIQPPTNVKGLRKFLGMVQYYRNLWEKWSDMLAPLTDLVGECGHTKMTKQKGTKKRPWYWSNMHQKVFDAIKAALARDVLLAYPTYSDIFAIYTDASKSCKITNP